MPPSVRSRHEATALDVYSYDSMPSTSLFLPPSPAIHAIHSEESSTIPEYFRSSKARTHIQAYNLRRNSEKKVLCFRSLVADMLSNISCPFWFSRTLWTLLRLEKPKICDFREKAVTSGGLIVLYLFRDVFSR